MGFTSQKSLVLGAGWVGGGEAERGLFGTPPSVTVRFRKLRGRSGNFAS